MKSRSTFTVFHFFVFVLVAAAGAAAAAARPFFSTMAASVSLAFRYPPSTLLPRSSCWTSFSRRRCHCRCRWFVGFYQFVPVVAWYCWGNTASVVSHSRKHHQSPFISFFLFSLFPSFFFSVSVQWSLSLDAWRCANAVASDVVFATAAGALLPLLVQHRLSGGEMAVDEHTLVLVCVTLGPDDGSAVRLMRERRQKIRCGRND